MKFIKNSASLLRHTARLVDVASVVAAARWRETQRDLEVAPMKFPNDAELRKLEDEFKARRAPDRVSNLARFVPTMLRFHLDGYSRQATYEFLKGTALISCSRASFYRWIESNLDLAAEAKAYAEVEREALPRDESKPTNSNKPSAQAAPALMKTAPAHSSEAACADEGTQCCEPPASIATFTASLKDALVVRSSSVIKPTDASTDRAGKLAMLSSILSRMEEQDMGVVAERTLSRLDKRDSDLARAKVNMHYAQ
ncbi:hypothetical protein [Variovorax sp. KK3]|uniref:hypothetical protein n=1 Tax=Variovorax sp. KK3 TaxID=1855728 RepID=UPI00097BC73C|nr:hypothetical protein [Variovorax sp. KK3]